MSNYTIKLCDHTTQPNPSQGGIQSALQGFFTRVFNGTSDSATVSWGTGSASDNVVVHFVPNRDPSSYIVQSWGKEKLASISEYAGGHTTMHHREICSEIYQTVVLKPPRTGTKTLQPLEQAKLAFHECIHNVFPAWDEVDLNGHGGLGNTPVGADLSQWDIDTMRRGLSIHSVAKQKL